MDKQRQKFSNKQFNPNQTSAEKQISTAAEQEIIAEKNHANKTQVGEYVTQKADCSAQWTEKFIERLEDEAFLERYVFANKRITDTVIHRYLLRLSGSKGVHTLGSVYGECALPPVKRPKTLSEAKQIADTFIEL